MQNTQIALVGAGLVLLLGSIVYRGKIQDGIRGLKVSMQSQGVATTKRDKAIDVLLSKEFWLFVIVYGGAAYVFMTRRGTGENIMAKAAIAGMLISILAVPVAYWLAKTYVKVKKRLIAALDASESNLDMYVTDPNTARKLRDETDERVGRRYDSYDNKVGLVQEVEDASRLDVRGLGPRETPDDDSLVADPKRMLAAWRDSILDTFKQVRDELAGRPAQQATAEYETANQLIADFEQSVSRYGEKQEEAKREMSSYDGVESEPDKPESEEESLGELARQLVDSDVDDLNVDSDPSGGGSDE